MLLQHPDGKTALIRGDVDAWAGLDPMMAQAEVEDGAKLFYRNADANTWGILNVREEFLKDHPDLVQRVLEVYEEARKYSLANSDDVKRVFIAATKLPEAVVDKQLKERTELTHSAGSARRRRIDPRGRPRAAAGRRHQGRRRREGDGRRPDRRPLGGGDELSSTSPLGIARPGPLATAPVAMAASSAPPSRSGELHRVRHSHVAFVRSPCLLSP